MYCHSAVAFSVFMFFSCFYVLRTVCVVVFFSVTLLIYSAVGLYSYTYKRFVLLNNYCVLNFMNVFVARS